MTTPEPVLREQVTGELDSYILEWYCLPPAAGTRYRVTLGMWTTEGRQDVRKIYAWQGSRTGDIR